MSGDNKKAAKGRPTSAGKRKGKFDRYFANTAAKKLRNVRKRNGRSALAAYKNWLFEHRATATASGTFQRSDLVLPREPRDEAAS